MATREEAIELLKTVFDPEVYLDVWTLGLIYDIDIVEPVVNIKMTFTSVACPAGPHLVAEIKDKLSLLQGIDTVNVEVVFDPPWQPSEDLKAMLGIG